jgi:hypothetical protein
MIRKDVLVWGGGTGGVSAALQAARSGASTILLTPGPWLGGMVSAAGVCAPDGHELSCWQTGMWGAFLRELHRREPSGLDQNWVSCFGYRPQQAEDILQRWVHNEPLLQWCGVCELRNLSLQDGLIRRLDVQQGATTDQQSLSVEADIFIDGSDLGDLLALTDVPYRWGWEAQEQWDEPSAPTQQRLNNEAFFKHQPVQSPTWVVMGQLKESAPPSKPLPPQHPFELSTASFGLERTITYGRLPGGLVMLNWPLHGNDWHHGLHRAVSSDPLKRTALANEMKAHSASFLSALQQCSDGWMTPGKAFPGVNPCVALMPYWRESRRLIGTTTVTENDLLPLSTDAHRASFPLDASGECTSIAVGTYANDHHYPGEDWPLAPKSCRWGGRWTGTPFCIPYGALVSEVVPNLLMADKGFSVSHMANGATRLQPLILNLGQAAGLAAALSVHRSCLPIEVPVNVLQTHLIHEPTAPAAVLPLMQWPAWHPHWTTAQEKGLAAPDQIDSLGFLAPSQSLHLDRPGLNSAPTDHQEELLTGKVSSTAEGGFQFSSDDEHWPLITLEPAINQWLLQQDRSTGMIRVRVVRNPWGPWLRLIGVID